MYYVFEKWRADEEHFTESIVQKIGEMKQKKDQVLLITDVEYEHRVKHMLDCLEKSLDKEIRLFCGEISKTSNVKHCGERSQEETFLGRKVIGKSESKHAWNSEESFVAFVGSFFSPLLENLLLRFPGRVLGYDPSGFIYEFSDRWKVVSSISDPEIPKSQLMKRFYMVEKLRDSNTIGILVLTLSLKDYLPIISSLKEMIHNAGKKHYLFVIGKLNVSKLLNFSHIDSFVVVSCPFNAVKDSKKYMKPLATPFELQVALQ